jgi:hypothetical protein
MKIRNGFSLFETLMAITISMIVVVSAISLYVFYQRGYSRGSAYLNTHADARLTMDWIVRDGRTCRRVIEAWGTFSTSDDTVIFEIPSIDVSGDIIPDTYDHIIYNQNGNNIERIVDAQPSSARADQTQTIARRCQTIFYTTAGAPLSGVANPAWLRGVEIAITTSETTGSPSGTADIPAQLVLNSAVRFRNRI